jgi:hypothetical protein
MDTKDKQPNMEREFELIQELHKKGSTHTEIAKCLQRERKIFKTEPTDIGECLKEVENTILNLFRWRGTTDEHKKTD